MQSSDILRAFCYLLQTDGKHHPNPQMAIMFSYSQGKYSMHVCINTCVHRKHCLPYLSLGLDRSLSYANIDSLCDFFLSVKTLSIFNKKRA